MFTDKKAVLNGLVGDIEEYRKKTGWLLGVSDALDSPHSVAQMLERERERRRENDEPTE